MWSLCQPCYLSSVKCVEQMYRVIFLCLFSTIFVVSSLPCFCSLWLHPCMQRIFTEKYFPPSNNIYSLRTFIWYAESSCTPYSNWIMHKERKKERNENKSKFSCMFFSAFVWASRTLGEFSDNRIAKVFVPHPFMHAHMPIVPCSNH